MFGREEKYVENVQVESKTKKSLFFFDIEVPRAFYSPDMLYEAATLVASGPSRVATSEASQMGLILKPLERS